MDTNGFNILGECIACDIYEVIESTTAFLSFLPAHHAADSISHTHAMRVHEVSIFASG